MKLYQIFVAIAMAALFLISSGDAVCVCNQHVVGLYCGNSHLLHGCLPNVLYQCNGHGYATVYKRCRYGCVTDRGGKGHCKEHA
ncbi:hypothetical protein BCR41DRAFT_360023 [Lobosporangium transversale]|uniref:Uncharacterized protein n=1 Tax=Lobosporangium transversale TaxID=64571 RepID=A0A1Y2GEN2_9FUNG|nr:hypothetical protein BCR41DRAFT_360023 [Lobosporangium transversale]ORZ07776.1 hypothetical protein BCR41DRAFT_360023 [Lobosporangium transversale]|eukprot:XP_021878142.1 hypothetical protein BCR41DRAFT_360023 [Lobosporangium transversale]